MNFKTYSLRSLFAVVAGVCAILALFATLGAVLAANTIFLVVVYYAMRHVRRRIVLPCLVFATLFAAIPWFRIGAGSFVSLGTWMTEPQMLPTIAVSPAIRQLLFPIYQIAALPLLAIGVVFGGPFEDIILYDSGGVRPFVFFVFWIGAAITTAAAAVMNTITTKSAK